MIAPLFAAAVLGISLLTFLKRPSLGLVLIITGGLSNVGEKALTGDIQDPFILRTFAFNIADILIILGACVVMADYLRFKPRQKNLK